METPNLAINQKTSRGIWAGRIISAVCILFLLVDAIMKIILHPMYVQGTEQLGWNATAVQPLGYVLLIVTLLYTYSKTSFYGALLLTGYLGGAVATTARIEQAFIFPIVFAMLSWAGLILRDQKTMQMFSLQRKA